MITNINQKFSKASQKKFVLRDKIYLFSGLFLSTYYLQSEFEKNVTNFKELIWSLKLEVEIDENLNYIPFSFYHLPNSSYYENGTMVWNFPKFEDKEVTYYFDHLTRNYKMETERLQDEEFKKRIGQTYQKYEQEIKEILERS